MGDIIILFFCQNIITFSLIFWLLTWVSEYLYKKKNNPSKKQIYECGFKSLDTLNIQINLNFILLSVFLILYDVELIFLIPFVFNFFNLFWINFFFFFWFLVLVILSLVYDWQTHALTWQF